MADRADKTGRRTTGFVDLTGLMVELLGGGLVVTGVLVEVVVLGRMLVLDVGFPIGRGAWGLLVWLRSMGLALKDVFVDMFAR